MFSNGKLYLFILIVLIMAMMLAVPVFAQSVSLKIDPEGNANAGESVLLTAATDVLDPEFRFGYRLGGKWYPTDAKVDNTHTYDVPLSFSGDVNFGVQVREAGGEWLALDTVDYTINQGVNLSVSPEGQSELGDALTLEAAAFGFKSPEYRFGRKYEEEAWGKTGAMATSTVSYTPTKLGELDFGVQVREAGGTWVVYAIVAHEVVEKVEGIPIANAAELKQIEDDGVNTFGADTGYECQYEGGMDKHYILVNDIDLGGENFEPVGYVAEWDYVEFTGVFDGQGYIIHNGSIDYPADNYIGLFARLGEGAVIENLGVEDVNVTGNYYVGGLVGYNTGDIIANYVTGEVNGKNYVGGLVGQNSEKISESYAESAVNGNNSLGGLAGYNTGDITASYATGEVNGNYYVGGLVGQNSGGDIIRSYAKGKVEGYSLVGGLVGENYYGKITESHAAGAVNGNNNNVGGLVGWSDGGTIDKCYSIGDVSGIHNVGGLVGRLNGNGAIENSYSSGNFEGTGNNIGGLLGYNEDGEIKYSYSIGLVSGGSDNDNVGGLVGRSDKADCTTNSYWDIQTSGQITSARGEGRTTNQMQTPTGPGEVVDEALVYVDWDDTIWDFGTANDYPSLFWE